MMVLLCDGGGLVVGNESAMRPTGLTEEEWSERTKTQQKRKHRHRNVFFIFLIYLFILFF